MRKFNPSLEIQMSKTSPLTLAYLRANLMAASLASVPVLA